MYIVVAYDIPSDGRRTKLHGLLRAWLQPVQRSVFEGEVVAQRVPRLVAQTRRILDETQDDVRILRLCPACVSRTLRLGRAVEVPDPRDPLIP